MSGDQSMDVRMAFAALGFAQPVSRQEAQQAYRELLQMQHPDKYPENEALRRRATEQTKQLNQAWTLLKSWFDSESRRGPTAAPPPAKEPESPRAAASGRDSTRAAREEARRSRDAEATETARLRRLAKAQSAKVAADLRLKEAEDEMLKSSARASQAVQRGAAQRTDVLSLESAIAGYSAAYRLADEAALCLQEARGEVGFALFRRAWNGGPLTATAPEEIEAILTLVRRAVAVKECAANARAAERARSEATRAAFTEARSLLGEAGAAARRLKLPLSLLRVWQAVVRSVSLGACFCGAGVATGLWTLVLHWATNVSERTWSTLEMWALAVLVGLVGLVVALGADHVSPMHVPRQGPPDSA